MCVSSGNYLEVGMVVTIYRQESLFSCTFQKEHCAIIAVLIDLFSIV